MSKVHKQVGLRFDLNKEILLLCLTDRILLLRKTFDKKRDDHHDRCKRCSHIVWKRLCAHFDAFKHVVAFLADLAKLVWSHKVTHILQKDYFYLLLWIAAFNDFALNLEELGLTNAISIIWHVQISLDQLVDLSFTILLLIDLFLLNDSVTYFN